MGKFINPFTDFGFKHIFGREMDKDILIEFLNDLLEGEYTIMDLRIMNNERLPETEQGRKVIFDIHCETDKGERIIIEMQNREQPHFKDRALYYLSHSVVEQGIKGTWDYELAAVYGVFFLNFTLDEENGETKTGRRVNSEGTSYWRTGRTDRYSTPSSARSILSFLDSTKRRKNARQILNVGFMY